MTLIIGVIGSSSIWLLNDRRLSFAGRRPRDDARKLLKLETHDGKALLGYAGLGLTRFGVEPSDWMARIARGLHLPMEGVLSHIADAIQKQLPRQLDQVAGDIPHCVVIPALVDGQPRMYSIVLLKNPITGLYRYKYDRRITGRKSSKQEISPRILTGGSGAKYLPSSKIWARKLINLIRQHENGRVSAEVVAKFLAELNSKVACKDSYVSKRCIVTWGSKNKGGASMYFSGVKKDEDFESKMIPDVGNGIDIRMLIESTNPLMDKLFSAMWRGEVVDKDEFSESMRAIVAKLPDHSDSKLS